MRLLLALVLASACAAKPKATVPSPPPKGDELPPVQAAQPEQEPEPLPPPVDWPALPPVSILVAAWNEAARIDGHIESFRALRYPRKELVLCAGGDDGTYERACRHAGPAVIVLRQEPGEGKQRALARAFAETRGEIIFLTDADCLLTDEAFERTLRPVAIGEEQAATGGLRPLDGQLGDSFVFAQADSGAAWAGSSAGAWAASRASGRSSPSPGTSRRAPA